MARITIDIEAAKTYVAVNCSEKLKYTNNWSDCSESQTGDPVNVYGDTDSLQTVTKLFNDAQGTDPAAAGYYSCRCGDTDLKYYIIYWDGEKTVTDRNDCNCP